MRKIAYQCRVCLFVGTSSFSRTDRLRPMQRDGRRRNVLQMLDRLPRARQCSKARWSKPPAAH